MITATVFILTLALAGLLTYMFWSVDTTHSKIEESVEIETLESQPQTWKRSRTPESPVVTEEVHETHEEMEARLKSISNPDSEKPFAKISVPEPAEVPSDIAQETVAETSPELTEKKKRSYKKRAPKKKVD